MVAFNHHAKKTQTENTRISLNKQKGVVLVVSLVFLGALTAVASALMLNSTSDMKMSGASGDKVVATQEAYSAMDELIYRQVRPTTGNVNTFALSVNSYKASDKVLLGDLVESNTDGNITEAIVGLPDNDFALEVPCPHSRGASSVGTINCNVLEVRLTKQYGRNKTSTIEINAGIAQQLL